MLWDTFFALSVTALSESSAVEICFGWRKYSSISYVIILNMCSTSVVHISVYCWNRCPKLSYSLTYFQRLQNVSLLVENKEVVRHHKNGHYVTIEYIHLLTQNTVISELPTILNPLVPPTPYHIRFFFKFTAAQRNCRRDAIVWAGRRE